MVTLFIITHQLPHSVIPSLGCLPPAHPVFFILSMSCGIFADPITGFPMLKLPPLSFLCIFALVVSWKRSSMCHLRKPTVAHVPPGWSSDPVSSISSWPSSHRFFFSTLRVPGVLGASLCPLLALLLQFLCVGQTEALTTPTKALCPVPLPQESSNLVSSSYVPCSFSLRICHVLPCIIGHGQGSAHRLLSLRGGFESQSLPFGGGYLGLCAFIFLTEISLSVLVSSQSCGPFMQRLGRAWPTVSN